MKTKTDTRFRLWKKLNDKWVFYAGWFDHSDKASNSYIRASRLMDKGWIPYAYKVKNPDGFVPLPLEIVDYSILEEEANKDVILSEAGKWLSEHIQSTSNKPAYVFTVEPPKKAEAIADMVLQKSIQKYKEGKNIDPYMLQKVKEYLSMHETV